MNRTEKSSLGKFTLLPIIKQLIKTNPSFKRLKKVQSKKKERAALEEQERLKENAEKEKLGIEGGILLAAEETGQLNILDEEDQDVMF
jgi:hypothetical protein